MHVDDFCGGHAPPELQVRAPREFTRQTVRSRVQAPAFYLVKVITKAFDDAVVFSLRDFPLQFPEREVDNVVMMDFFVRQLVGKFEPNLVQQVDFLRGEPRRV
jgi:hypothetical protein